MMSTLKDARSPLAFRVAFWAFWRRILHTPHRAEPDRALGAARVDRRRPLVPLIPVRVVLMTREYPPEVYGGAGVHVAHLARVLARSIPVEVRCFGRPRAGAAAGEPVVRAYGDPAAGPEAARYAATLETISINLAMAAGLDDASLVHSHTWYANLGGHAGKLAYGIPHVMTSHSLEPKRLWKAEQLGAGGHALSSFCERTAIEAADAVIAASAQMRLDILDRYPAVGPHRRPVVHNGVDPDVYRPDPATDALERHGVDPDRPSVGFVG